MTRTRVLVVLSFLVALAAGLVMGAAVGRTAPHPRGPFERGGPPPRGPSLAQQLDLSADQQQKMREIWSGTMQNWSRTYNERRDALRTQRDQLIQELLTPEQRVQRDVIMQEYEKGLSELAQEGRKATEEANKRTMELLNQDQRKKFEEIQRQGREHGWGPPGRGPGRNPPPPRGAAGH